MSALFELGITLITASARDRLHPQDVFDSIGRHRLGIWGDLCPEDRQQNERALREGGRLLSAYHDRSGTPFWIITEADRSVTTVLLSEDY